MDSKIKYGLIAGVGTVALFLLFYLSEPAWMLSPYLWWGSLVIYIWAMAKASKPAAKIDVKLGLREGFAVYAIANAIFYLFYYFQFTNFAPELVDVQKEMISNNGMFSSEEKEVMIESVGVVAKTTFFIYVQSLVFGFALAFGLSAFLSRME